MTETMQPLDQQPSTTPRPRSGRRFAACSLVGLLVTFVGLELAVRQIGERGTARSLAEQHRANLAENAGAASPPDRMTIVFAGDSSTGAAFDADEIARGLGPPDEVTAYNVWLPGASPLVVGPLVEEFLLADGDVPDQVVVGITARMFNTSRVAGRRILLDEMRSSLPWRSRVGSDSWTGDRMIAAEQFAADRLGLVRYRAGLRRPTEWVIGFRSNIALTVAEDGQVDFFGPLSTEAIRAGYESGERRALADYEVAAVEVDALLGLVDRLSDRGSKVSVAILPTYGPIYDPLFPGERDNANAVSELRQLLDDEAVSVIDLTGLSADVTLFADGNHLNDRGSEAVSAELVRLLSKSP